MITISQFYISGLRKDAVPNVIQVGFWRSAPYRFHGKQRIKGSAEDRQMQSWNINCHCVPGTSLTFLSKLEYCVYIWHVDSQHMRDIHAVWLDGDTEYTVWDNTCNGVVLFIDTVFIWVGKDQTVASIGQVLHVVYCWSNLKPQNTDRLSVWARSRIKERMRG